MLYVVGLGSGSIENMTKEAFDTLESCSLIVGYGVYVDLIKDHFPHKEYYTTPMNRKLTDASMLLNKLKVARK